MKKWILVSKKEEKNLNSWEPFLKFLQIYFVLYIDIYYRENYYLQLSQNVD